MLKHLRLFSARQIARHVAWSFISTLGKLEYFTLRYIIHVAVYAKKFERVILAERLSFEVFFKKKIKIVGIKRHHPRQLSSPKMFWEWYEYVLRFLPSICITNISEWLAVWAFIQDSSSSTS